MTHRLTPIRQKIGKNMSAIVSWILRSEINQISWNYNITQVSRHECWFSDFSWSITGYYSRSDWKTWSKKSLTWKPVNEKTKVDIDSSFDWSLKLVAESFIFYFLFPNEVIRYFFIKGFFIIIPLSYFHFLFSKYLSQNQEFLYFSILEFLTIARIENGPHERK